MTTTETLELIAECEKTMVVHVILNTDTKWGTRALKNIIAKCLKSMFPLKYCTVTSDGMYNHPICTSGSAYSVMFQYDKNIADEYSRIIKNS